ncbi:MAG: AbrB/MazE/SpoVT family DNA-binding domain-containing protein [bacterium]
MTYTHSITSKGQITIPLEFRKKLNLDKIGRASIYLNDNDDIVITRPKSLDDVRKLLKSVSSNDDFSENDKNIGKYLAQKYENSRH